MILSAAGDKSEVYRSLMVIQEVAFNINSETL